MLNAKAPGEDGNLVGLSDDIIFDQLITLGIAGSDTTANTLSWILYLLDKHPGIHRRVLQELANADITPDQPVSVKQANSLKYLTQVIKEILRMFPPVPALSKTCGKTCVLPGGYIAYEGMRGLINVWSLHHNEKVYPDAYSFNPDRFSEENAKSIPEGAWLPFSSGPRACLGMSVAMIEMRVVLARLLSKYEFPDGWRQRGHV
ncbi:cytochrome P450 [Linderina pennispora]|uniref:Cytochrome P450 n=1 Tax=Linderina pennispora TaxID=61395 RepID=A0A1Y1W399_9FUNG|nr:cytochrome P450 [Linderina pennispora]ORX67947.1 cytochrome P450 [Linderina pennispora]